MMIELSANNRIVNIYMCFKNLKSIVILYIKYYLYHKITKISLILSIKIMIYIT